MSSTYKNWRKQSKASKDGGTAYFATVAGGDGGIRAVAEHQSGVSTVHKVRSAFKLKLARRIFHAAMLTLMSSSV